MSEEKQCATFSDDDLSGIIDRYNKNPHPLPQSQLNALVAQLILEVRASSKSSEFHNLFK